MEGHKAASTAPDQEKSPQKTDYELDNKYGDVDSYLEENEVEDAIIEHETTLYLKLLVKAPKAKNAIYFYKDVLGAVEVSEMHVKRVEEGYLIIEARLKIGGTIFLVADSESWGTMLFLETVDVASAMQQALSNGVRLHDEPTILGKREGIVKDPLGFVWQIREISLPLEELSIIKMWGGQKRARIGRDNQYKMTDDFQF